MTKKPYNQNKSLLSDSTVNSINGNTNTDTATDTDVYSQLQKIANGDYSSGNSNAYGQYQSQLDRYNALKNVDTSNYTTGQLNYYNNLLANVNKDVGSAKSYYDQYLDLENQNIASKNAQYEAQQNALKYTKAQMNASGYANQGLAESTIAGMNNATARNVASLDAQKMNSQTSLWDSYQTSLRENDLLNSQELASAKAEEQDETYNTYLSIIESRLKAGDTEGAQALAEQLKGKISSNQQAVIDETFRTDAEERENSTYSDYDSIKNASWTEENGEISRNNIGFDFGKEMNQLQKMVEANKISKGDTITIRNQNGRVITLQYNGSGFKQVETNLDLGNANKDEVKDKLGDGEHYINFGWKLYY